MRMGGGQKSSAHPSKTQENQTFLQDILGRLPGYPGTPKKFEKKEFVFNFRTLIPSGFPENLLLTYLSPTLISPLTIAYAVSAGTQTLRTRNPRRVSREPDKSLKPSVSECANV